MDEGLNSAKELGEGNIVGADSGEETTRDRNYSGQGEKSGPSPSSEIDQTCQTQVPRRFSIGARSTWETDTGSHLLELRRLPCAKTRADAGAILAKWNSVREHDRDNLGLPNISRHGQGLWTYESIQYSTDSEGSHPFAAPRPHRFSEASGLVIYVQVCNPVEIEAKARELFEGSDVIGPPRIRRCACFSHSSPLTSHPAGLRYRGRTPIPWLVITFGDRICCLVQSLYSEEDQLTKERPAERTVRPTVHARRTPLADFTTAWIKKRGIDGITGAEVADGLARHRQALRRQIGVGEVLDVPQYTYKVPCMRFLRHSFGRCVLVSLGTWPRALEPSTEPVPLCTTDSRVPPMSLIPILEEGRIDTRYHPPRWHRGDPASPARVERSQAPQSPKAFASFGFEHGAHFRQPHPDALLSTVRVSTLSAFYMLGWGCSNDTGIFAHEDNALKLRLMRGWVHIRPRSPGGLLLVVGVDTGAGQDHLTCLVELREDACVGGDNEVPFGVPREELRCGCNRDVSGCREASTLQQK
ncbi:hypothetical protein EDB83DRAFT_2309921 [Lactarius deliciosus]|nr:hypothetical protein EDB83DRAFT_2309921 [Lactarius deliciosus]